jgi:hypothetical protein
MRKRLFRIIGLTLLGSTLVLGCMLAMAVYAMSCPAYPTATRTEIPSIPAPPGLIGTPATRLFPPTPEGYSGSLLIQTTSSPLDVLRFYEARLPEEGWQPNQVQTSNMMLFIINKEACPFYGLQFVARQDGDVTRVVIDPYLNDSCDCD